MSIDDVSDKAMDALIEIVFDWFVEKMGGINKEVSVTYPDQKYVLLMREKEKENDD